MAVAATDRGVPPQPRARQLGQLRDDRVVRIAALVAACWLLAYAVAAVALTDVPRGREILGRGVYELPIVIAACLSFVAAYRNAGAERWMWALVGGAVSLTIVGDLLFTDVSPLLGTIAPFSAASDAAYLLTYLLVLPAVAIGFAPLPRSEMSRLLLDGSIIAIAIGVGGYELVVLPAVDVQDAFLPTAIAVAYPTLDLLVLALVATLALTTKRRIPAPLALVAIAYAVSAISDGAYTQMSLVHDYAPGDWIDLGWQAWAVLLAIAAIVAIRHPAAGIDVRAKAPSTSTRTFDIGLGAILIGASLMLAILMIDLLDGDGSVAAPIAFAVVGTMVAVIARLLLTANDKQRIARELETSLHVQQQLATTDGLTGLHNQRFFTEILRIEVERARRKQAPLSLLTLDLDRFKTVNDRYGHPAGDVVLSDVGRRLASAARRADIVVRQGGEEFAVLMPEVDATRLLELGDRLRRAIGTRPFRLPSGEAITVTTSVGAACIPTHASTAAELLSAADKALYAAKALGRDQVQVGGELEASQLEHASSSADLLAFLQRLATEIDDDYNGDEHSQAMARWISVMSDTLELPDDARRRCTLAARFHDIGKIAVPRSVLSLPRPLTQQEWDIVRQHPAVGAHVLTLVPGLESVAEVVAAHHEHWDGSGYPRGLIGVEIPIEARIIAVCDAWAAMRTDRPYRGALTRRAARDELQRGAGQQFDPHVVSAFLRAEEAGRFELDSTPAGLPA